MSDEMRRRWFIAIDKNGFVKVEDIDYLEHEGIDYTAPGEANEFTHIKTPEEPLQDVLDKSNEIIDRRVQELGAGALIEKFLMTLNRLPKKAFREDTGKMADEEALVFIKNYNAYRLFSIITEFIDGLSRDDGKKFSRYEQGLFVLDDFPLMFGILKEIGNAAGYSGEFYEMPLQAVFEQFMAADIYSSYDVQDWSDRFCIINGTDRVSGNPRRFFMKEDADKIDIIEDDDGERFIIPEGYTDIGANIFGRLFYGVETDDDYRKKVKFLRVSKGVKKIWNSFCDCINLENVMLPYGVEVIGDRAFYGCARLRHVSLPETVTTIGENAFSLCNQLMFVSLTENVTAIADNAFDGCRRLKIHCIECTYAHAYAIEHEIQYYLSKDDLKPCREFWYNRGYDMDVKLDALRHDEEFKIQFAKDKETIQTPEELL